MGDDFDPINDPAALKYLLSVVVDVMEAKKLNDVHLVAIEKKTEEKILYTLNLQRETVV